MFEKDKFIFETKHWEVGLADDQTYLGYCIVLLKRQCGDLAEITSEELTDFHNIVGRFETALRKAFDATMFNWSCLMNHAYREAVPKPQVHWHARPRYNHEVIVAGETFADPNFGSHYTSSEQCKHQVSRDVCQAIVERIRKNLPL